MRENEKPMQLPIDDYLDEIVNSYRKNQNIILTAPPGTGKTSRVPAALLKSLLSRAKQKKIIVLVPRRIAALSSAARVADENNWQLGSEVGYQVRFENKTSNKTQLIFMTEGVFIKKITDPNIWEDLEYIVFDEFHERSSQMDLALGICLEKQILEQKIKMMIMSATLNVDTLSRYLGSSLHFNIPTPVFALELIKSKKSQMLSCDFKFSELVNETLQQALIKSKKDILIFLPGLSEIKFIERKLLEKFSNLKMNVLHGSIKLEEQKNILNPQSGQRRVILSTNIAESSLTIPSVDCVIDSGLVKKTTTENKIGFKKLEISRISLFSAKQRAGRAARTGPGFCFQLWHDSDERSMPEQIQPEIITSDLLEECLTLASLDISDPENFSWLSRPKKKFSEAIEQLILWELLDSNFKVTAKGVRVQSCPLDIERSLLFVELSKMGHQAQAAEFLAFIETTNFDKQTENIELNRLVLTDLGAKIKSQLLRISISSDQKQNLTFKDALTTLFFKYFPNKIAKKKDRQLLISSLGRGVEISPYLINFNHDYYLLFSGRELNSSLTKCDYALGISSQDFETHCLKHIKVISVLALDSEKKKIYKIDKKTAGNFTLSESSKVYIDEKQNPLIFKDFFSQHFSELLAEHDDYKIFTSKLNFLKNKINVLSYGAAEFDFMNDFNFLVFDAVSEVISSINEFLDFKLGDILLFCTPEAIRNDLNKLPDTFTLPNGKKIQIDYLTEQAPKISARIQDFFGLRVNPTLLNGKVRMNVELLGPNYRPAQLTNQLENFWSTSYLEIRKELKARYPKHAWPENP